jgi:hypothetical protein
VALSRREVAAADFRCPTWDVRNPDSVTVEKIYTRRFMNFDFDSRVERKSRW